MRLKGDPPNLTGEERCFFAPIYERKINDKPSSLLAVDGRLHAHFHSPLGDAWIGYIAVSDNYGNTWLKNGFYREWESAPDGVSPWTRRRNSPFRCLLLFNMGRNGMGMGTEWSRNGGMYLCRVKKECILDYSSYRYFGTQ